MYTVYIDKHMNENISQHVHIIENQRISATLLTSSNSSTTRCSFGWLEGCTPCCALFLHTPDLLTLQGTKNCFTVRWEKKSTENSDFLRGFLLVPRMVIF